MGMFDNVLVSVNVLPLDDVHKKIIHEKCGPFQTKSLSSTMDTYRISGNGTLWLEIIVAEYVEIENKNELEELFGSIKTVQTGWEIHFFTGTMNFYSYYDAGDNCNDMKWYEFDASFINGKLQHIVAVDIPGKFIEDELLKIFT